MLPGLPDITVAQLLQRLAAAAVVLGVYGFATAAAARAAGDQGPKYDGRLSFNPLGHLDIVGLLAIVFFRAGWMRPLEVDSREFRTPRRGAAVVMIVSTTALIVLACVAHLGRQFALRFLTFDAGITVSTILSSISEVAVGTAVLGLLPLPPLLGSLWWAVIRPGGESLARRPKVVLLGYVLVVAILLSGLFTPLLRWSTTAVQRLTGS